jgi:hypothetical protein
MMNPAIGAYVTLEGDNVEETRILSLSAYRPADERAMAAGRSAGSKSKLDICLW